MADLRNTEVPGGALQIEIDDPLDSCIEKPVGVITGWFATRDLEIPKMLHLRIGGMTLPYDLVTREDVQSAMPDHTVVGFAIPYDLTDFLPYIQDNRLAVHLTLPGYEPHLLRFKVEDSVLVICLEGAGEV